MNQKPYGYAAPPGRPPSEETKKRLAAPCCEKCRNLVTVPMETHFGTVVKWGLHCSRGKTLIPCSDFDDASRSRSVMESGSRIFAP